MRYDLFHMKRTIERVCMPTRGGARVIMVERRAIDAPGNIPDRDHLYVAKRVLHWDRCGAVTPSAFPLAAEVSGTLARLGKFPRNWYLGVED